LEHSFHINEEHRLNTQVTSEEKLDLTQPIIRKTSVTAHNDAMLRTDIDCGEFGLLVTDEPLRTAARARDPLPCRRCLRRSAAANR